MASPSNPVFPSPPTSWSPPLPPPPPSSAPAASSEKKERLLFEHLGLLQQGLATRESFLTDDDDAETCLALSRDVSAGLVLRLRLLASTIVGDGEDLTLCFMKGVKAAEVVLCSLKQGFNTIVGDGECLTLCFMKGEKAAEVVCSLKEENVNVVHCSMIPVISTCVGLFMRDSGLNNPAEHFAFPTLLSAHGCCMINRLTDQDGYPCEIHAERYAKQLLKPDTAALTGVCEYFSPALIVATGSCTQAPGTLPQPAESLSSQKVRELNQQLKRRRESDEGDRANRRRRRQGDEDEEEEEEEEVDEVIPHDREKGVEVFWRDLVGDGILRSLGHIQGVPTMPTFEQFDEAVNHILTQSNRPTDGEKEYYSFRSTQRTNILVPAQIPWVRFRSEVIGVIVHAMEGDELPEEAEAILNELEDLEGGEAEGEDDPVEGVVL